MADLRELRQKINDVGDYDLHDVLSRSNRVGWCERHLNIDKNDNAIEVAEKFHKSFKKLKPSSSIIREIDIIEKTFLEFLPTDQNDWNVIRNYFKEARKDNSPEPIIKAYTLAQTFTNRLQVHSAANTYHSLKLYCTVLNCPILAQTQEYTEAFTRILFHPKLEQLLVRKMEVYRGAVLDDKKFIANYKEGATIITTTFLSTSATPEVAEMFSNVPPGNMSQTSVLCTYNINNVNRHTAIDVKKMTNFDSEKEIIILRYVPFTVRSVEQTDDGRKVKIYFDECKEKCT